mgnify:CR=1 FL=1
MKTVFFQGLCGRIGGDEFVIIVPETEIRASGSKVGKEGVLSPEEHEPASNKRSVSLRMTIAVGAIQ